MTDTKALVSQLNKALPAIQKQAPAAFPLEKMKDQLVSLYAAGGHEGNLQNVTPMSVVRAFTKAISLGLDCISKEMGEAYLVPYGKTCTLQIGYRGYAKLARQHGGMRRLVADMVLEGEEFEIDPIAGTVRHRIDPTKDRTKVPDYLGAYAVAWMDGQPEPILAWVDREEMKQRKAMSKSRIWDQHPRAMWRKTAIRVLLTGGSVELSPMLAAAVAADDESERFGHEEYEDRNVDPADSIIKASIGQSSPAEIDTDIDDLDTADIDAVLDEVEG